MDLKIFSQSVESSATEQIYTLAKHPAFSECKMRIMPDVHAGAGCVIGFTADLGARVIPNIVGVDIGCGVLVCKLSIDMLEESELKRLDEAIRKHVPSGKSTHESTVQPFPRLGEVLCADQLRNISRIEPSVGTLGGGNHFIAIERVGADYYLVIHSGSRNLGKQVADIYQREAIEQRMHGNKDAEIKRIIAEYKSAGRDSEISGAIKSIKAEAPDKLFPAELSFLTGEWRERYLHDMIICQEYAMLNRVTMASIVAECMGWAVEESFCTVHNYIDIESNIVRKGAVSAKKGEKLIIPMNMRDGSLICIGKGNEDWNCSAPHGAGRTMSRSQARRELSMGEFESGMVGVFTTSVSRETLDEAPMAYKPMEEIVSSIGETVDIVAWIKPVYNFKASE